jgi:hypothetical protein
MSGIDSYSRYTTKIDPEFFLGFGDVKKPSIQDKEYMNIRRLTQALRSCPRDIEAAHDWIEGNRELDENEKRIISSIVINLMQRENFRLPGGYLEERLRKAEGEKDREFIERASSFIIEAYTSSEYRGFLKNLICSSISSYRADGYSPEVAESPGNIRDSLTGEDIHEGEVYYDVRTALGDHEPLKETSLESLKRMDLVLKRIYRSDYFYNQ